MILIPLLTYLGTSTTVATYVGGAAEAIMVVSSVIGG